MLIQAFSSEENLDAKEIRNFYLLKEQGKKIVPFVPFDTEKISIRKNKHNNLFDVYIWCPYGDCLDVVYGFEFEDGIIYAQKIAKAAEIPIKWRYSEDLESYEFSK